VLSEIAFFTKVVLGRAIALVVIRRLPIQATRVRALSGYMGYVVNEEEVGQVFS
jgi:hypothetical protein